MKSRSRYAFLYVAAPDSKIPPPLVQISQVQPTSQRLLFQKRRHIPRPIQFLFRPSISPVREPILRPQILVLPVLPPRLSPDNRHMSLRARPQAVDTRTWSPTVGPTTAVLREVCAREKGVAVGDEVVCRGFGGLDRLDVLGSDFAQELADVSELRLDALGDCARGAVGVGSVEMDQVREARGGEAEVGVWEAEFAVVAPGAGKIDAFVVDHGKGWREIYVCACAADYCVDFAFFAVFGHDTPFGKVGDAARYVAHVGFRQGLKVSRSWGQAPTVRWKVRDCQSSAH